MRRIFQTCALLLVCCLASGGVDRPVVNAPITVEVGNNQPFRVRMPLRVRDMKLGAGAWTTDAGQPVQQDGSDAVLIADVNASSSARMRLEQKQSKTPAARLTLRPEANGVGLLYDGNDAGRLSWDAVVREAETPMRRDERRDKSQVDFAKDFSALPLAFNRITSGAVFDVWRAETEKSGLKLKVDLNAYHAGFLDINAQAENLSAPLANVYAAIICHWKPSQTKSRTVNYNNHIAAFGDNNLTPFRGGDDSGSGEFRHMYIQRGVDWVNTNLSNNTSVLWLNDFSPSFTVHQDATDRRPARWTGANSPQLTREAQTAQGSLYSVTELAHANTRYYQERFVPNVLPPAGEPLAFSSRLVFNKSPLTDERADQEFIAYTGYAEQRADTNGNAQLTIGVPGVRFGTNYFPYSTLGENFTLLKLPGMDRAAYWPLAADTVTQWRLFTDDIRRDLRIAKAMGVDLIRLHHLELISPLDEKVKTEYLDFLFNEMRRLQLRALLDAQMKPEEIASLVRRYRDAIHGVELENEILIFGINDGREKYWNAVYDAVKKVDPQMPVHLTGHTNAGAFTRLERLGGKFDRIGQHAYMDSLQAIPSARGYALAIANYARKVGKPSVITEWNWRGLTRLPPEARARVYAPIFENVLKTRSVPEIYQFQFNESLAMDTLTLKGIRHYEPIWFSRRPKPEALELMRLIKEYSLPANSVRTVDAPYTVVELDAEGRGTINFRITNTGARPLNLRAAIDAPSNMVARFVKKQETIRLAPRASIAVPVEVAAQATTPAPTAQQTTQQNQSATAAKPLPGFYQIFLRLEGDDKLLRYGWAEARLAGAPQIDRTPNAVPNSNVRYDTNALAFDFNRPLAVVYGDGAPIQDVETASALVNTLESATGRTVAMYNLPDVPPDVLRSGALILVGTTKTNQLIAQSASELSNDVKNAARFITIIPANATRGERLVIGGATPEDAERAAMDLIIRFWKYAKDSAARRIGLVAKEIPQGGDPALLP